MMVKKKYIPLSYCKMLCSAIDHNIHRDIAMYRHRTSRDILSTNSEPYRRAKDSDSLGHLCRNKGVAGSIAVV